MDKYILLFESFNKAINDFFELHEKENEKKAEMLAKSGSQSEMTDYIAQTVSLVQSVAKRWENTPVEGLGGITPKVYIESINDFEGIMDAFKAGASILDVDLPYTFLEKLKTFSDRAVNALLEIAGDSTLYDLENGNPAVPAAAISALRIWKSDAVVRPLLELMRKIDSENELILETISDTLTDIGPSAAGILADELDQAKSFGMAEEYIFSALSKVDNQSKSDKVYRSLKSAFAKAENKALAALFLADYGDGRAIPSLRGYVEKSRDTIDRATFYDIKYAVEKLGGSMEDIKISF